MLVAAGCGAGGRREVAVATPHLGDSAGHDKPTRGDAAQNLRTDAHRRAPVKRELWARPGTAPMPAPARHVPGRTQVLPLVGSARHGSERRATSYDRMVSK